MTVAPAFPVVKLGTELVLTCIIASPRPAAFSWEIDGSPVTTSSDRFVLETSSYMSTLNITSLVEGDLSTITCTASDPLHLPISTSVVVTETEQLYLFGDRTEETLCVGEGEELRLVCPIRSGLNSTTLPMVRWFLGTRELRDGVEGVELQTANKIENDVAILGEVSVKEDDRDEYECEVTDADAGVVLKYFITVFVTSKRLSNCLLYYAN